MDDHNDVSLLPLTPPNTSDAEDTHEASANNENSDNESLLSFNFDAPAADVPREGAIFATCVPPPSSRMPESIRKLGIFLNKKRRRAAAAQTAMRGGATAWLDQDDSGTYDPKRKRATPDEQAPQKKAAKKQKRSHSPVLPPDENGIPQKGRETCRKVGYSLLVTLTLESEKGVQYLRSITPGPNGSAPSSSESSASSADSDRDSGSGSGSFPKPRQPERLGVPSSRLRLGDLAVGGHPQRRGCKTCVEAGDDACSLIADGSGLPCEACRDARVQCELILQPLLKGVCVRCKGTRRRCSYRVDAGSAVDSCELCEEEGVKCCAGPVKEGSYARRVERGEGGCEKGDAEGRERMWVACNQCRGAGKRCSNKGKTDWGPCSGCRKSSEECKFVLPSQRRPLEAAELPLPIRPTKRNGKASGRSRWRSETPEGRRLGSGGEFPTPTRNSQTLFNEVAAREGRRSRKKGTHSAPFFPRSLSANHHLRIPGPHHISKVTSFCHPIKFNYEPDPMGKNPCSFCDYPTFGICGLQEASGPRTVEGYYVPACEGGGFEEIHGGYSEAGYTATKMCAGCTFARLRIVGCRSHGLRKLVHGVDVDPRVWDEQAWNASCEAIHAQDWQGARLVYEARYCSVCPDLAHFACCTQSFALDGEREEGCGLLLCERCKDMMGHCFKAGISGTYISCTAALPCFWLQGKEWC